MDSTLTALACAFLYLAAFSGQSFAQQDKAAIGTFLGDARLIITSEEDDLRLWAHPPRVIVITSDRFVRQELADIRETIEREVSAPYGKEFFGKWQFIELSPDFAAGYDPLRLRIVRGGPSGQQIQLYFGKDARYLADIVIAVVDRPTIAVLNGLWGLNPKYTRAQMQGSQAKCYYSARSWKGRRRGAFVSIVRDSDRTFMRDCLWEEVIHTLGPLTDAIDTPFFTFDNRKGVSAIRRANDIALIRALYESGARAGDHPNVALAYLAKLASDSPDIGRRATPPTPSE